MTTIAFLSVVRRCLRCPCVTFHVGANRRQTSMSLPSRSVDDAEAIIRQLQDEISRLKQENELLQHKNVESNQINVKEEPVPLNNHDPLCMVNRLSKEQIERYSRQLLLEDGFGVEGQCKLLSSSVLVVGAGGIGSTVILYLAAAGVGKITIVDFDDVEVANLHRQIIHKTDFVGRNKAVSACHAVQCLNPTISSTPIQAPFTHENAMELVSSHDCIVDATDNPRTRYLINDACVLAKKPLVSGSAIGTEGQVSVYLFNGGSCYRCLYPQPDSTEGCKSCSDHGVLGTVPGLIGILQATETLKVLTGIGTSMQDRLLMYDSLRCSFLSIKKPPKRLCCPVCGPEATVHDIKESGDELVCVRGPTGAGSQSHVPSSLPPERVVSCFEYNEVRLGGADHVLLDVRVSTQFEMCSLKGAINIPLARLYDEIEQVEELSNGQKPVYCLCRRGIASTEATRLIMEAMSTTHPRIHSVFNISGGLQAWRSEVDSSFPSY